MPQIKPMSPPKGVETAMMPDVLLGLPLENLRMYGERKE
jgi:hypothetical protein